MDKTLRASIDASDRLSEKLVTAVKDMNDLLEEANSLGLYILLQKEETHGTPPKISLKLVKATFSVEFISSGS